MAKGSKREGGGIGELLAYAGDRKFLTYLGMALSALSQLLSFGPYVCIWLVARDLIAVAPNWSEACDIAMYGWWAVGFALASIVVYFMGLMCTHLSAFRCASNIRKTTSEHLLKLPLGYFDTHATGELRRIVDGCAASTETLLAHMLPDIAGATAMVVGLLVLLFALDWRLGAACLISVAISFGAMATMMSGKGAEFMKAYMGALVKMNKTGTEYVRGIPVVKVFQQTVYSFKAFHDAIAEYADMAQSYAGTFCRGPQVLNLTALNGLVAFLLPVTLLLAPGETDFAHFMVNFTFYAIFSAVVPTAMTKLMFVGEASQMSADSLARIRSVMDSKQLSVPAQPKHSAGSDVRFEDVSFTYEGAEAPAVSHVSFSVPAGSSLALVGPSGGGKSTCASLIPRFWDVSAGRVLAGGVDVRDMEVQRVALARAILKDAPIVVLDEATAFADPENEALIQRAFSKLAAGRTVIMIAHRLSTVVGADQIVVLNQGSVQESGTHAELLSQNGLYAKMWAEYERAASWKIAATTADAAVAKGGEA